MPAYRGVGGDGQAGLRRRGSTSIILALRPHELAQPDAAAAAQRTQTAEALIYGNLLPLHEPRGSPKSSR